MTQSRIKKLEAKRAQIDAQLQDAKARERVQKRKDDTRCKIIAGALALEHAERNSDSEFTRTMMRLINEGVKSDKDRALFDLEPLPTSKKPSNDPAAKAKNTWRRATKKSYRL